MNPREMVNGDEKRCLLRMAREAILSAVEGAPKPSGPDIVPKRLKEERGVFVTLWQEGLLRGCIGFPLPSRPLIQAVTEAAVSAALGDPRFPDVVPGETAGLVIEISVLTVPRRIAPADVRIGVHGLIVSKDGRSGLLLPQVAVEQRWDVPAFLEQTCAKAGLPPGAWREEAELSGFEAQVFSELDETEKRTRR